MANDAYILIPGASTWRIVSAQHGMREVAAEGTADESAGAIVADLKQHGYRGQGVLLGLPSEWCLPATIVVYDLPPRDRAALMYRLEEQLPLAAEQFTADFARFGEKALAVAAANERIAPLVLALEQVGVMVQSVSPLAMLAMQSAAGAADPSATIIWQDDGKLSLVALRDGRPAAWSLLEEDQLKLAINLVELETAQASAIERREDSMPEAAARLSGAVLSGRVKPWFELRRGAMAASDAMRSIRPALNAMLASAVVLLIVLAGSMLWRGWKYDRLARDDEAQLAARFRRDFLGWTMPANVRAVVESERRKLAAKGSAAAPAEARQSALRLMRDVLGGLPGNIALAVDRMTINDTSIEIEGRAKSYEDVNPLAASAKAAGLDVPTPQMRKTADGMWSYVVRGSAPAKGDKQP